MILGHVYYITIIRFCMLSVLLHDVCTICTMNCSYEIGTMILLITQDFVFRHRLFRYGFCFFAFLLTLHFWFLYNQWHYNWIVVVAFLNCEFDRHRRSMTAASNLQLGLWASTWTHTFICRDCQVITTDKLLLLLLLNNKS